LAPTDRRSRLLLLAVAAVAVVIGVVIAARGRTAKTSRAPGPNTASDPWSAPAGGDVGRAVPLHLPNAAAAFLRMRPAGPVVVVTGIVTLAPGGTPVAGAEVAFMNDTGENTAIADDSGRYSIKVASGIWWKVHARAEKAVGYPETFTPSSTALVHDLEVHPTASVRGQIVDMRGGAVPGAEVSVVVDAAVRGLLESALQTTTTADEAGRYQLQALPGAVTVKAAFKMQQGIATVATLAPGETATVDVRVLDPITVSGRVVRADNQPVAGAKILAAATISPGGPTEKQQFDSGDDGGFAFTMPAGWLRLEGKLGSERSAASAQWVNAGGRLDGVTLTIAEPVALRGRIVTTAGTPVDGARVRLVANAVYDSVSGRDGSFAVAAIPGQAYTVKIKHSDGSLQRDVASWNGEETFVMRPFGGLTVIAANQPAPAELSVAIDSFLPEGETVARAPAEARFRGAGGEVQLGSLEPGRYDLTVSAKGLGALRVPRVVVGEGGSKSVTVTLAAPSTVRGVVKSSNQPVGGAQVTVAGRLAFTDAKGRWSVGDVAAGPIAITVMKQGFGNAWVSAIAGGDEAGPVEIELRAAGQGVVDGVGVVLSPGAQGAVITSVLPGSPADGKLAAGDRIESIDGTDVGAAALEEIVARLRGAAGSSVSITIHRGADSSKVDVVRKRLVVPQGTPAIALARTRAAGGRRC